MTLFFYNKNKKRLKYERQSVTILNTKLKLNYVSIQTITTYHICLNWSFPPPEFRKRKSCIVFLASEMLNKKMRCRS